MKFIGILNGWTAVPELWRYLLWPPLRIRRAPVLRKTPDGERTVQEAPAVYSIQVLGVVIFVQLNGGCRNER